MTAIWVNDDLDIDYNTLETLDGAFSRVFAPSNTDDAIYRLKANNSSNRQLLDWLYTHQ